MGSPWDSETKTYPLGTCIKKTRKGSTFFVVSSMPGASHMLSHLILTRTLFFFFFKQKTQGPRKVYVSCPRSHSVGGRDKIEVGVVELTVYAWCSAQTQKWVRGVKAGDSCQQGSRGRDTGGLPGPQKCESTSMRGVQSCGLLTARKPTACLPSSLSL